MDVRYAKLELILKIDDVDFGSTVKLEFINCEIKLQADFMIITTVSEFGVNKNDDIYNNKIFKLSEISSYQTTKIIK